MGRGKVHNNGFTKGEGVAGFRGKNKNISFHFGKTYYTIKIHKVISMA